MKIASKNLVRTMLLGSVLAGGITLAQSFYSEAQSSAQYCSKTILVSGGWICVAPSFSPSCSCGSSGLY